MNILKDFQTKNSMNEKCKDVSIFCCNCNGPECRSNNFSIIVIRFAIRLLSPNLVENGKDFAESDKIVDVDCCRHKNGNVHA